MSKNHEKYSERFCRKPEVNSRVTLCIDRYGSSTTHGMSGSCLYLWECARIKIFISSSPGIGINLDNFDLGTAETSTLSSIRTKS